jgi:RND family efflux transporter MFP subunit
MKFIRFVLPIMVIAAGLAGSALLVKFGRKTQPVDPPSVAPLVETVSVELQDHRFRVRAQGNVAAAAEIDLTAEVSGRVEWVSSSLAAGGFFDEGAELIRLERRDFELALVSARSQLTQFRAALTREEAEAAVALEEWRQLGQGQASPLLRREPQLAQARAAVEAAEAMVEKTERDLARCVIRAPFVGRVERKVVDVGQFVSRGARLGRLYAVDRAEVRLPIPESDLAFLDLPLAFAADESRESGPAVRLSGDLAGRRHEWHGSIVRTEGRIDSRNRMIYAVVQVDDPYQRRAQVAERAPLAVGLFVDCEIEGRTTRNAARLPRRALRNRDEVWVVDAEDRLRIRQVEVLRAGREYAVVGSGLRSGERVCVSSLDAVVDGMTVRSAEGEGTEQTGKEPGQ